MNKVFGVVLGTCVVCSVQAGGYRVATQGQKALAMGHTGVAMTDSAEAIFFNPGAITQLEADVDMVGGFALLASKTEYKNSATPVDEETDSPLGTPVNAYFAQRLTSEYSWGFGIYTPFGNKVEWDDDWAGSHLVNNIKLQAIYLQPTLAYQINESTSIGGGPNLVLGSVKFNRNLSTSLTDEKGNRSNVTIEENNVPALGYSLGILHKVDDTFRLGASFRSKVTVKARDGDADFDDIPDALKDTFKDGDFDADLPLPAELTVGAAWDYSDRLTLAFDYNYTFWDTYDELVIEFDNGITSENPRNYKNASTVRFGAQYHYDEKWTFRGGVYFDESPVQDGYFAPETPRNDSIGYTAGLTYRATKQLEMDFSLLILTFDDEDNSYDYYEEGGQTIPFGGNYDSAATAVGFGLRYTY